MEHNGTGNKKLFSLTSYDRMGKKSTIELFETSENYEIHKSVADSQALTVIPKSEMQLADLRQSFPELFKIGTGVTVIGVVPSNFDLIRQLEIDNPFEMNLSREEWEVLIGDVADQFPDFEELKHLIQLDDLVAHDRWIKVNDSYGVILTKGNEADLALICNPDDFYIFDIPLERAYSWHYHNDGGGPVTWDGTCVAGFQGRHLFLEAEEGDSNPGIRIKWADEDLVNRIAKSLIENNFEFALALSTLPMPGFTADQRSEFFAEIDERQGYNASFDDLEFGMQVLEKWAGIPAISELSKLLASPNSQAGKDFYTFLLGLIDDSNKEFVIAEIVEFIENKIASRTEQ